MLDVPYDLMLKRLKDGENFNDQMETVQRRVNTYRETTEPVIAAYSANITKVGGGGGNIWVEIVRMRNIHILGQFYCETLSKLAI